MKLTPFQKRQLAALRYLKADEPSLGRILLFRPLSWLRILFIAGLCVALYFLDPRWGLFSMGMITGAVLRIFATARFTLMAWPLTDAVTDWKKVEALAKEEES